VIDLVRQKAAVGHVAPRDESMHDAQLSEATTEAATRSITQSLNHPMVNPGDHGNPQIVAMH
jgi:hypothetical protein